MDGSSLTHSPEFPLRLSRPGRWARVPLAGGFLALSLALLLLTQVWAGLALRGLYADGCYYAARIWLSHGFVIIERSRWTAQLLTQLPVVLAMRLANPSPLTVARMLSLSTTLMPFLWTMASFLVLPRRFRGYALFPLATFLTTGMSAALASIADAPLAAAYLWLLLLLIAVAPLTRWRLAAVLLLSLGTLHLHETTAILGPILIFACIQRARSANLPLHRAILLLTALLVAIGFVLAMMDIIHPRVAANRDSFLHDLTRLRWLGIPGIGPHLPAWAGLLALLALVVSPLTLGRPRFAAAALVLCAVLFALIAGFALVLPATAPSAFAARGLSCLVSVPTMLILLAVRGGWPMPRVPRPFIITLMAMLSFTLAVADGAANREWLGYAGAMRQVLASKTGVISWATALAQLSAQQAETLHRWSWPWTAPLMSLWLLPAGHPVLSLISNPPGTVWEPISLAEQHGLLDGMPPPGLRQALSRLKPSLARGTD
jgi:hypothetical protein